MPEKRTVQRARRRKDEGKAPTTQAGEFVREEIEHVEQGKHRGMPRKQAVAVGLSKARRAGVDLKPPESGRISAKTRRSAQSAHQRGQEEGPLKKKTGETKARASRRKSSASKGPAKASAGPGKTGAKTSSAGKRSRGKSGSASRRKKS